MHSVCRPSSPQSLPKCPTCGAELKTPQEQQERICREWRCRGPWLNRRAADARRKQRETQAAWDRCARETLRQALPQVLAESDRSAHRLIVVPGQQATLAVPSAERRDEFRSYLEHTVTAAVQLAHDPDRATTPADDRESVDNNRGPLAVINACSTCRGACCRMGRPHAFLTAEFLAERLAAEPGLTPAAMLDEYLQRIPDASVDESCLYHTATGCALPREIRSAACNEFLCAGLRPHEDAMNDDPNQPTTVVAFDRDKSARIGVMDDSGHRTEYSIASPAARPSRPPTPFTAPRLARDQ